MSKLAIVGNGFDLSHGLKTGYYDFYKSLEKDHKTKWQNLLKEFNIHTNDWYDFEEAISNITNKWHEQYFESCGVDNDFEKQQNILLEKINQINSVFRDLDKQLFEYILNEEKKPTTLKVSIQEALEFDSYVITFNYTNLIKKYCKNIYHIHGSISEEFIVLGYKLRAESTAMAFIGTKYNKLKLREKLNFRRFLKQHNLTSTEIGSELEKFDIHVDCMYSGKGGYEFDYSKQTYYSNTEYTKSKLFEHSPFNMFISNCNANVLSEKIEKMARKERLQQTSEYINSYGELNDFQVAPLDTKVPYSEIDEVIILGHSLKADIEILEHLFPLLTNLDSVILFTFNKEKENDILEKEEILINLTNLPPCKIKRKLYDLH